MSERLIQNSIVRAIGTRSDVRIMRANVGLAIPSRIVRAATTLMRQGDVRGAIAALGRARPVQFGVPGQADLTGILAGGFRIEIECKGPKGRQSDDQKNYQAMVERFGGLYVLARSVEDVEEALDEYVGRECV